MGTLSPRRLLPYAGLIFAGCVIGTFARAALATAFPHPEAGWPWATFWINVVGSVALGALLEALGHAGDDSGWRRAVRLGVGTGVIGGFTTYSTFVVEIDQLARAGAVPLAAAYAPVSVFVGLVAAVVGMAAVSAVARRLAMQKRAA
ncbi:MAG: CrcB family protein [Tessaracoccus sp.]|uniref:FluC/FEX family fluoride channel n=1 Tax=Tessaracoccus sp. TaxID=1971211 RepID=UPI001ECFE0ED|nr:CrcB family protein [Tessaracoccus sp.]MBK7821105.1 CrcB family protein [Tessaracoccus sp.]